MPISRTRKRPTQRAMPRPPFPHRRVAIAPNFGNYVASTDELRDAILAGSTTALIQLDLIFGQIRTHLDMTSNSGPKTQMTQWKAMADTDGKIVLGYEGGQHFSLRGGQGYGDQTNTTLVNLVSLANRDVRMYNLYLEYLDEWKTRTGNALMFSSTMCRTTALTVHGSRGIRGRSPVSQRWTLGTTNHKYKAVWDWINGQTLAGPSTAPSMSAQWPRCQPCPSPIVSMP